MIEYAENPDKTTAKEYLDDDLYSALSYVENDDKTDRQIYVDTINCSKRNAYGEMVAVQKRFGSRGDIVAWHGFQSFAEGEVTPEEAFEIGKETARRMWGDKYQVVVTVHLNTDNLHCHFVVNPISFKDGSRFQNKIYNHRRLREVSDEVCRERGKSVLENSNFYGGKSRRGYKGGTAPVGYELVKSGRINKRKHELYDLKVKEDDADIVRLIFSKYVNEGYGVQKIANYLNCNGYKNPTGNPWSHNTIRNILQNETYVGILRSGDTRSPHLPELQIVPQELFDRAQDIRRQRAEAKANTPRVPINMRGHSLLSGNVFCGHCGSRLHLTTTTRYYKKADGTIVNKRRIRYACYKKVRKMADCGGQSGYSAEKLDRMVEEVIKNVFKRMRGISKEEMIASRYDKELSLRKTNLIKAKADLAKEQEKLSKLRAEVIKSIQGESAYSQELLAGLVNETDEKVRELESICTAAERELAEKQILMKDLSDSYDEIISWSELYDSASFEAKKMIVNAMIIRIDVFNGYELNIEFNFNIRQFFEGIANEEETETEAPVTLPKTA